MKRIALTLVAALLALLVLGTLPLVVPGLRERFLTEAIRRADVALPGRLHVGRAAWPALGTIHLRDVTWTEEGDTLASVGRLEVRARLRELRRSKPDTRLSLPAFTTWCW